MPPNFAKAIVKNIDDLIKANMTILLCDSRLVTWDDPAVVRVEATERLEKAKTRLAAVLQEPGAKL